MTRFHRASIIYGIGMTLAAVFSAGPARIGIWAALSVGYSLLLGAGVSFIGLNFFCDAVCRGRPGKKRVSLTFDDGPDPRVTPLLLDALKELGVKAAFFCVGRNVEEFPGLVRRMAEEGHTIGNHTFRHKWTTNFFLADALADEIRRTQEAVRKASGVEPRWFRPPVGLTNPHLRTALGRTGLRMAGWDVRSFDRGARAEVVIDRVARKTRDGSIVLLHDGGADPEVLVSVVRKLIARFHANGYYVLSLDELVEDMTSREVVEGCRPK